MSDQSVEARAARVSMVTGGSVVVSIVVQLVSVPICLHFWGARQYGEWLAILAAANFLRVIDAGYTTFAGNRLNLLYHDDHDLLRSVLASGIVAVAILGVVELLALFLLTQFGGLGWLLGSRHLASESHAQAALTILVASWVVGGSYFSLVHRLMVPTNLLYQSAWWSMAYQVALFLAIMCAATLRLGLLETSIVVASTQAITYVLSAAYVWLKVPEFSPWKARPNMRLALSDIRDAQVFSVQSVAQQLSTNGLVVLISSTLGATVVPVFTTTRTAANLWNSVISTFTSPLLPDIVRLHVQRQGKKLLALADAHVWLVETVVVLGIVISYPLMVWAYGIWTHHQLVLDQRLLAALLASMIVIGAGSFMTTHLAGINDKRAILVLALSRAGIGFVLALALLRPLGITGVGVALLIAEVTCYMLMAFHYFPNATNRSGKWLERASATRWLAWGAGIACLYLAVAAYFERTLPTCYAATVVLCGFVAWRGWKTLEAETRTRLIALGLRLSPLGGRK